MWNTLIHGLNLWLLWLCFAASLGPKNSLALQELTWAIFVPISEPEMTLVSSGKQTSDVYEYHPKHHVHTTRLMIGRLLQTYGQSFLKSDHSTHPTLVPHICASESGQHWFK